MKATVDKIENNVATLEVEVPKEEFAAAYEKAAREAAGKVSIPGFRKGKVPTGVLEKNVGVETLIAEAVEKVIPKAYYDAVGETAIEPIDQPDIELVTAEKDQPLMFRAKVQVKPDVKLGEYKGLKVEKKTFEIKDTDVAAEIDTMRGRYAKLEESTEGTLEQGDVAVIDFEGFVDGEAFDGGKGENHSLELGSGSFIPGFEEQLVGKSVGEETEVEVSFPEDYHAEHLAGKPAVFKVKLNASKRKVLPELDDEFAKDVSEFETLDELKADMAGKMQESANEMSANSVRMELLEAAAANAEVEVPDVLIREKIESYIQEFENRLKQQGVNLDQYIQMTGMDMDRIRQEYRPQAESQVKIDLTLEAIVAAENVDASEEEISAEIDKLAAMYSQEPGNIRQFLEAQGTMEQLIKGIKMEKAVALIEESAEIVEVDGRAVQGQQDDSAQPVQE